MTARKPFVKRLLTALAFSTVLAGAAHAQAVPGLDGRWEGAIDLPDGGKLTGVFNVVTRDGATTTTFDSPDQGARGLAASVTRDGDKVTFEVPLAAMTYAATVSADGKTLSGNVRQGGGAMPLTMMKKAASAPLQGPLVAGLDGRWEGDVGSIPIVLRITSTAKGTTTVIDSPSQGATDITATASRQGQKVIITAHGIAAGLEADLSADGKTLTGDWLQAGNAVPASFTRK